MAVNGEIFRYRGKSYRAAMEKVEFKKIRILKWK